MLRQVGALEVINSLKFVQNISILKIIWSLQYPVCLFLFSLYKCKNRAYSIQGTEVTEIVFVLGCTKIKPVNPKGNQPWIFIGRTDAEALILWPPDAESQIIGKDPYARKDWGQEKGIIENEMVRWHHWLGGHDFKQILGDNEGQGSLACCSPWGWKGLDMN